MRNTLFKTARRGFTLIELMVVVAIIGILAAMAMSVFTGATAKARNAKLKGNVKAMQAAVEQTYNQTTGVYGTVTSANFATGTAPTDVTVTYNAGSTAYCIISDALNTTADTNAGANCSAGAAGVCTFTGTLTSYCVKNIQ